jgi:aminoglycoside phosphotransferase (APT) family kinase protein
MIGRTLGHYEIVEKLGEGGMGAVYRARDTTLGRDVALKLLPEFVAGDGEKIQRLEREARLLASLSHPNIATLHGLEESNGQKFLVMELVPGETLAERIVRGPLRVDECLGIFRQIAEGLEAAHEKGIIPPRSETRERHRHPHAPALSYGFSRRRESRRRRWSKASLQRSRKPKGSSNPEPSRWSADSQCASAET